MKVKIAVLVALAAFAAGCSGMKVNHDYDHEADFSSFKTFAWHESGHTIKDTDPLAHERLIQAIDTQMNANGFQKVSSNPDVVVTYNVEESEEMALHTSYMGGGWGMGGMGMGGMGMGAMGMGGSTTTIQKYNVGTLVVDMWDANAKRLVWRATASGTLSTDPQKNAKKINEATEKLFKAFPPTK